MRTTPDQGADLNLRRRLSSRRLHLAGVCLVGLAALYRPIVSGMVYELAGTVLFGLVLLAAAFLWLCGGLLAGRVSVRFGLAGAVFSLFLAATLLSCARAENWFAGLQWWWLMATYGLTGFLVLQTADREPMRRFYLSCVLATGVALAAYGLWHYAFYMPALRRWYEQDAAFFQAALQIGETSADDLRARILARRAYGSFITSNQLADFLVLTIFPLAGLVLGRARGARPSGAGRRVPPWARLVTGAMLALMLAALYLAGSKGGWAAFGLGLAVFALAGGRGVVRRRSWRAAAIVAVLVLLGFAAWKVGAVPGRRRIAASLGVRLQYWRTTAAIALERPILGVGPGSWPEWYAMLKAPEFEETRAAHNAYLQLWAETGAVGIALFLAFWGVVAVPAGRKLLLRGPVEEAPAPGAAEDAADSAVLRLAGLCLAALALAFDYCVLGTFLPPGGGGPAWFGAAALLPYLVIYAVWAGAFAVVFAGADSRHGWLLVPGICAGLAAFLLHSGAEFTLVVPAIGGTVAVLAAVLLAQTTPPRRSEVAVAGVPAALVLVCGMAALLLWSGVVARRVLDRSLHRGAAERVRLEMATEAGPLSPGPGARAQARALLDYRHRACAAVPWDDEDWRALADGLLGLAEADIVEGAASVAAVVLARAQELNPLKAANWARQGRAYLSTGNMAAAAASYRRAAELDPSTPLAWYRYAACAESIEGQRRQACEAYRRALALLPRQYHRRNTVLGPALGLLQAWADVNGLPLEQALLEMWRDPWEAGRRELPWDELTPAQRREYVLGKLEVDARELWLEAGPAERWRLILAVGAELCARAGRGDVRATDATGDRIAHLSEGLAGARELAEGWDALDDAAREAQLWSLLAPRLWQWVLEEKVRQVCEGEG